MKEIKFNKKEEGDKLIVDVELPEKLFVREPVINFSNSDMIKYLEESGVKIESYELSSQTADTLTSYADKRNEPKLSGTWIFTKKEEKKVNKKITRSYNKKDINKTGD